ncbi:MAG: phosphatidylglycerophosphatase A [bacterium]
MKRLILFTAYGFGLGKIPIIPATFGTSIGVLIFLLASQQKILYLLITLLVTIGGIKIAEIAEDASKIKDDRRIVIDEVAGFLITMIGIPNSLFYLFLGFFLFRALDIIKPFPIRYSQRLKAGLGIMMDDLLAGIFSCIILNLIHYFYGFS